MREPEGHTGLGATLDDLGAWPSVGARAVDALPDEVAVGGVVAHAAVGEDLNLNAVAIGLGLEAVRYEPDEYPGLIYRPDGADASVLMFADGTLLAVGATDASEAETALTVALDRLEGLGVASRDGHTEVRTRTVETAPAGTAAAAGRDAGRPDGSGFDDPAGRAAELRELAMEGAIEGDPPVGDLRALVDGDDPAARVDAAAALAALGTTHPDAIDPVLEAVTDALFVRDDAAVVAEHHLRGIQDLESRGVGVGTVLSGVETALDTVWQAIDDLANRVAPEGVPGGGATEAAVANAVREAAEQAPGREQLVVEAVADAVEAVPTAVSRRAGMDPIDALVDLRTRHMRDDVTAGIDPDAGEVTDVVAAGVTEPAAEAWLRLVDGVWAGTLVWTVRGTVSQLDALLGDPDDEPATPSDDWSETARTDDPDPTGRTRTETGAGTGTRTETGAGTGTGTERGAETGTGTGTETRTTETVESTATGDAGGGEHAGGDRERGIDDGLADAPVRELLEHLDGGPDRRREAVAELAARAGDDPASVDGATDALVACLDDDDPAVRKHACEALGHVGGREALDALRDCRLDPDVGVSEAAREAIDRIERG